LGQNIEYRYAMSPAPRRTTMILTEEQALLKGREQFEQLVALINQASDDGQRIDTVERSLMRQLLALGHTLLGLFIAKHGEGDLGQVVPNDEGRTLNRLPEKHDRRYVSIFGELTIPRFVYGTREGQKIERAPLDEQLGLPETSFSYVLEDWSQRICLKESFAEAAISLETLLGLRLGSRTLEKMNQHLAGFATNYRASVPSPPTAEEGPILVVTADGKGVPMRRPPEEEPKPHHRRTKGEKANKKQMACVGAVYSVEPFVRTTDDILDEVMRHEKAKDRPKPQHKHVWAEMSRDVDGFPLTAKEGLFCQLCDELTARNLGHDRPVVCLMDGERALWEAQQVYFPEAVGVLDLFHVMERLWAVSHCLHKEGSDESKKFVEDRLRDLLEGKVGYVIGGFRQRLTKGQFNASRRQVIKSAIDYFENNREHMKYDEYLESGYPIGSGVAEGACRHLVKDRLEQTGMRWTVEGAQAMLHVRALYLNDEWDDFVAFRIDREQNRLYAKTAA
jgi:hypothetical protein